MDALEIITTSDGSHTLRNNALNETYHSVHGAVRESLHVFIGSGLDYFSKAHSQKQIRVLEVGFGTGLNALLAWQHATANDLRVVFTTLEPFPLDRNIWSRLNYAADDRQSQQFIFLHDSPWDVEVPCAPEFTIHKMQASLERAGIAGKHDVLFFDAFAPSVQPALWTLESLGRAVAFLRPGGVFVTYSAKGQLKRDLRTLGLTVETLAGPPGKNEMVRAIRN